MACLAIAGAMKSTPTAAMEVLLNLTPLDLLITAQARITLYRLHILKQPSVPKTVSGLSTTWKNVGDRLLDMQSDYIIPVYRHTKNFTRSALFWDITRRNIPEENRSHQHRGRSLKTSWS
jgi:hypothetical protein